MEHQKKTKERENAGFKMHDLKMQNQKTRTGKWKTNGWKLIT